MQKVYQTYSDPAHGWMKVKRSELKRLGIADQITGYSYQRGDYVYLEEDCDLSIFMRAKEQRNEPVIMRHYTSDQRSRIRNYSGYCYV